MPSVLVVAMALLCSCKRSSAGLLATPRGTSERDFTKQAISAGCLMVWESGPDGNINEFFSCEDGKRYWTKWGLSKNLTWITIMDNPK